MSREAGLLGPLGDLAERNSWLIETAASPWDAMERLQTGIAPDLLLLDLPRGDGDSLHILRWLRRLRPEMPVIVICFPEYAARKREAIRLGAQEVLIRPLEKAWLESTIHHQLVSRHDDLADVASELIEPLGPDSFFLSPSPITQQLRAQAELLAEADVPVLILGEAGSGKDTVARLIHKLSIRSGFKFLKVNCPETPVELLEKELLGNGSSSNGGRKIPGKIEGADKGTVFLDEITGLPMELQARLMSLLQNKVLLWPGSGAMPRIDVRIIASTSASIDEALAAGKLREDLYYRLSAFTVQVRPLRQRRTEIAVFLRHSMHRLAKHYGLSPREFSQSVIEACLNYSWPGNLTELESFVKRFLLSGDEEVAFSALDCRRFGGSADDAFPGRPQGATGLHPGSNENEPDLCAPKSLKSLIESVKSEAERKAIETALLKTGWNRKAAARLLQVSYRTLLYKIDQYHMRASEPFFSPPEVGKSYGNGDGAKSNRKTS